MNEHNVYLRANGRWIGHIGKVVRGPGGEMVFYFEEELGRDTVRNHGIVPPGSIGLAPALLEYLERIGVRRIVFRPRGKRPLWISVKEAREAGVEAELSGRIGTRRYVPLPRWRPFEPADWRPGRLEYDPDRDITLEQGARQLAAGAQIPLFQEAGDG
jgi:hypothetical protein